MAVKSSNVMARVEPNVKMQAESVMNRLGIPASVVINALYHQIIYTNSIPFSLSIPDDIPALESMSDVEFDTMMETGLKQADAGLGDDVDTVIHRIRSSMK